MKSLLMICVFLLLPLQTLAMPAHNRLSVPRTPWKLPETEGSVGMEAVTIPSKASSLGTKEHRAVWRALLHKGHSSRQTSVPSTQNTPQEHSRERRHIRGLPRGQLKRVGCVLGTCQVQNLSHRLYQLMGQSGREDSPINPRSPHSYG